MEEKKKNGQTPGDQNGQEEMKLDDARRVKVLSPTQLVLKRFFRNKLAITGLVILVFMFLFSFLGSLISPYSEAQVFRGTEEAWKDYAGAAQNTDMQYLVKEGESFSGSARTGFVSGVQNESPVFTVGEDTYTYEEINEESYLISKAETVASITAKGRLSLFNGVNGFEVTDEFREAYEDAVAAGESSFVLDNVEYVIAQQGNTATVGVTEELAIATMRIYDAYQAGETISFEFVRDCEMAMAEGESAFTFKDVEYQLQEEEGGDYLVVSEDGSSYAVISTLKVSAKASDISLSGDFNLQIRKAIRAGESSVLIEETDADGNLVETEYTISVSNNNYQIRALMETEIRLTYQFPNSEHILGLDGNGMDVMTRLMYGGKVSLMVGFVVVIIELVLGIIIGGISGYFGGIVDTLLMRFVDLFNSLPFWPLVLIAGSVMDSLEVDATTRLFLMMAILGFLNWTGIARVVRGQILSLREQDFMVATEATGIRVSRRIFRHLVPNVMPLLIVQATMALGSIILTEATLSFLGLGIKYPMASWGSIINAANDVYVMTNYWFIWLPAGMLILLTVLGFNFVGDGLRDAFDPKMKR